MTGGATLIETETARISETKSAELLKGLPQNRFRFSSYYVALTPGASSNNEEGGFRFGGAKGTSPKSPPTTSPRTMGLIGSLDLKPATWNQFRS